MATDVIGLSGPAGSGKSEASNYLATYLGYRVIKFAGPLKAMLRAYYKEVGIYGHELDRRIEGDLKETPCEYLNGMTPRHAMETLGTEWGRVCMGSDFWINAWRRAADQDPGPVVVDDVRFDNEARAVREKGGEVLVLQPKVRRRKKSNHVAERGLSGHLVDQTIVNDGTVQDLRVKVAKAAFPDALYTFGPLGE